KRSGLRPRPNGRRSTRPDRPLHPPDREGAWRGPRSSEAPPRVAAVRSKRSNEEGSDELGCVAAEQERGPYHAPPQAGRREDGRNAQALPPYTEWPERKEARQ